MTNEIQFTLINKVTQEKADADDKEVFTYAPVDEALRKQVKISIAQTVGAGIVEDMGLPTEIGDKVYIEIGATNRQTKLTEANRIEEPSIHEPIEASEFLDPGPKQKKPRRRNVKKKN